VKTNPSQHQLRPVLPLRLMLDRRRKGEAYARRLSITRAPSFWLMNRQPAKWRDRREVDVSGTIAHQIARMTPAEREADAIELAARARRRLAELGARRLSGRHFDPSHRGSADAERAVNHGAAIARNPSRKPTAPTPRDQSQRRNRRRDSSCAQRFGADLRLPPGAVTNKSGYRLDQRGIERLDNSGRLGGHDVARGAGDHAVEPGEHRDRHHRD
jgi:hypothetical protein